MSDVNPRCLPWLAIYVKARHEKSVALSLVNKGLETFIPTFTKCNKNFKKAELPLFPTYVFCRADPSAVLPVISTPGVFKILGNGRTPEPIADQEMQAILQTCRAKLNPVPWPYVSPGQNVLVESGPLKGVTGVVIDVGHERWLSLSIHLLKRSIAVKLDRGSVTIRCSPPTSPNQRYMHAGMPLVTPSYET